LINKKDAFLNNQRHIGTACANRSLWNNKWGLCNI